MKVTALLILACLAVFALGVDPHTYGFVAAHPSIGSAFLSMFLHDPSNPWHLIGNMVGLSAFGILVERELGNLRYAALYFAAGLGGVACHWMVAPGATMPLVGSSGAIFGIMAAAAMLRPRLAGFVVAFAALNIWQMLTSSGGSVAAGDHVGGLVVGFVMMAPAMTRRVAT